MGQCQLNTEALDETMVDKQLILASSSSRRVMLLNQLGLKFVQYKPDLDESRQHLESPVDYVTRLSRAKASAVAEYVATEFNLRAPVAVILAADTAVVLDEKILGKPRLKEQATEMLQALSGREHLVITGVTVQDRSRADSFHVKTTVKFRAISVAESLRYWNTGEPQDKAGGYGIQGGGSMFVTAINGSATNVAGLPLRETAKALATFGIACLPPDMNSCTFLPEIVEPGDTHEQNGRGIYSAKPLRLS